MRQLTALLVLFFALSASAAQPVDSAVIANLDFLQQMEMLQTQELLVFYSSLDKKDELVRQPHEKADQDSRKTQEN
jgi:hypothetical protein